MSVRDPSLPFKKNYCLRRLVSSCLGSEVLALVLQSILCRKSDDPESILAISSPYEIVHSVLQKPSFFKEPQWRLNVPSDWNYFSPLATRGMGKKPQCDNSIYHQHDLGKGVRFSRCVLNDDLLIASLLSQLDLTPGTGPSILLLPFRTKSHTRCTID